MNRGSILFETIIGMALFLPIIAGVSLLIHTSSKVSSKNRNILHEIYLSQKVKSISETVSRELDQHRLLILPRVHKNSQITFNDGTLNPVSLRTDSLKPDPSSDAITYSSIENIKQLTIKKIDTSVYPNIVFTCPKFNLSKIPNNTYESYVEFIGLTTAGSFNLSGVVSKWDTDACKKGYKISLSSYSKSMISELCTEQAFPFLISLLPIKKTYTVYLDVTGRLRYLSHLGEINNENQPLLEGIKKINFNLKKGINKNLHSIEYKIFFPNNRFFNGSTFNQLSRNSYLNLILN